MSSLLVLYSCSAFKSRQSVESIFQQYGLFHREKPVDIWFDPFNSKPILAVVHFASPVGLSKPTWSAVVKFHKFVHKSPERLLKKFSFQEITQITSCCYEVVFKNGWDDVLAVCHQNWTVDKDIVSVTPYFDCFRKSQRMKSKVLSIQDRMPQNEKELSSTASGYSLYSPSHNVTEHTSSLFTNQSNFKPKAKETITLNYPGIKAFFNTEKGNDIVTKLLSRHDFPLHKHREKYHAAIPERTPDYRVIFLGKARIGSFLLHLVQGSVSDADTNPKAIFSPSEGNKCILRDEGSGSVKIELPPWKSDETDNFEDIRRLKRSFIEEVDKILRNSIYHFTDVAFSTSDVHSAEFPFPLDFIASTIIYLMLEKECRQGRTCNVYVFESQSHAVFKAFQYFFKKNCIDFKAPDVEAWHKISYIEEHNLYELITADVKIRTNDLIKRRNVLYCYPVEPSLKLSSTPVTNELDCLKYKLSNSIKRIEREHEKGLLAGQSCKVDCFINGAPAVLYSVPQWGPDCHQAIQDGFCCCLSEAKDYDTIHIVPPGLHGYHKFPKKYLVQTVCKVLHQLLFDQKIAAVKHVVLVVNNDEYKREFKHVCQKYFQNSGRKEQSWKNLVSFQKGYSKNKFIIQGNSLKIVKMFESELHEKLDKLMLSNFVDIKLNAETTKLLKQTGMFRDAQDLKVSVKMSEDLETKKLHEPSYGYERDKRMSTQDTDVMILTGSTLTIKGLTREWVEDFAVFITEITSNGFDQSKMCASYDLPSSDTDDDV